VPLAAIARCPLRNFFKYPCISSEHSSLPNRHERHLRVQVPIELGVNIFGGLSRSISRLQSLDFELGVGTPCRRGTRQLARHRRTFNARAPIFDRFALTRACSRLLEAPTNFPHLTSSHRQILQVDVCSIRSWLNSRRGLGLLGCPKWQVRPV